MGFTIGPKVTPGPRPDNDANHLYGPGFNAWRDESGCFLSWDGGEIQTREVTAEITEKEFERLRRDPSAFYRIALAHDADATPRRP